MLLRAGLAAQRGHPDAAVVVLRNAIATAETNELFPWTTAARRRLGEIVGGDEGTALIAEAETWAQGENVVNPDRAAEILAPGLRRPAR